MVVPHLLKEHFLTILLCKGHDPLQNSKVGGKSGGKGRGAMTALIQKADVGSGMHKEDLPA